MLSSCPPTSLAETGAGSWQLLAIPPTNTHLRLHEKALLAGCREPFQEVLQVPSSHLSCQAAFHPSLCLLSCLLRWLCLFSCQPTQRQPPGGSRVNSKAGGQARPQLGNIGRGRERGNGWVGESGRFKKGTSARGAKTGLRNSLPPDADGFNRFKKRGWTNSWRRDRSIAGSRGLDFRESLPLTPPYEETRPFRPCWRLWASGCDLSG